MKVIVGTNNGMMKVINLDENVQSSLFGKYELNNAVETMCWANPETEDLVAAGFSNGEVSFWNPLTKQLQFNCGKRGGKVKGLYTFEKESGRMVVSCTANKEFEICPLELPKDYTPTTKRLEGNNDSDIRRMRPNPLSPQHMIYMGYHIMPTLFDIERGKTVWRGEFGNPKFFGLKQRQFFTDFQFMPESASVFATGSRYREFRIYDLRKGNKPVIDYNVTKASNWEFAMISLAVTNHTPGIIYATEATGKIAAFDLRTGRLHKVYRDGTGTVKALAFHPTERTMAAVGLDRYLRVYDIDKRLQKLNDKKSIQYRARIEGMVGANMYNKVFLKQKLVSVLFFAEERIKKAKADALAEMQDGTNEEVKEEIMDDNIKEEGEDGDSDVKEENEDIWGTLEEVGDVKDEEEDDESDDGITFNIKDEPGDEEEDEDDEVVVTHKSKPTKKQPTKTVEKNTSKKATKSFAKEEEEEDDEEEDDEGDEVEGDEEEEMWNDDDTDFEIKLGEFKDDEGEEDGVAEDEDGEVGEGEGDEDEDDTDEDEDDEEEGNDKKPVRTKTGDKTDNKRKRREAKEKQDKKKKLKQAKATKKKERIIAKKKRSLK